MAHPSERRTQLRGLYVYKRLPMESACNALKIAKSTGIRWKAEARDEGDDWDTARSALAMGDENFTQLARRLIEDYLVQHQAVMETLRNDEALSPAQRMSILASAGDSFHKTMSAFKKVAPEINRHAIALDTLQRFASFAQQQYPQHVPAMLEMLEPFGSELAKAYG
tara:strand:+ start:4914 stop:5414 length:501 start_codon:yes stop_codon:yes gene_type:complete